MSCKRSYADQDPDYENDLSNDQKRLKVIEKDNKEATVRKIEHIISTQFNHEMKLKEAEIKEIDERLYQAIKMLDQLRMCVITSYYSFDNQSETALMNSSGYQPPPIHPAVKKYLCKRSKMNLSFSAPEDAAVAVSSTDEIVHKLAADKTTLNNDVNFPKIPPSSSPSPSPSTTTVNNSTEDSSRASRFKTKKRIVVGNVSKYIPVDKREDRDQSTHKWMVYVRGPKEEPCIENFVKKVWFFLHPSYRPNDLVEVNHPPFHLTRRGWGEFPVRVQLHFHDSRNKRVDIIHTLKLDKTYTGLQTLGSETFVDVLIYKPSLDSETVDCSNTSVTQPSLPHDIGGIAIPASIKEELQSSVCDDLCATVTKATFIEGQTTNIKQEIQNQDDGHSTEKCVSSFINDHGYYSSPFNTDLLKSEHSYQAEYPVSAEKTNLHVLDEPHQQSNLPMPMKVKTEPPDETPEWHSPFSSVSNVPLEQNAPKTLETTENYESELDVSNVRLDDVITMRSEASGDIVNQKIPLSLPTKARSEALSLTDSLSSPSTVMNHAMKSEPQCNKDTASSKIIQSANLGLVNQSEAATPLVNNHPINAVISKSDLASPDSPHSFPMSSNESSKLVPKISLPANSVNLSSSALVTVNTESKKSETQSQTNSGVATFVKCIDKRGNVFLIPLAMFLKINPSTQTSISQNILHNSSSLLKPSLVNESSATTSITNSNVSSPGVVLAGVSSASNTSHGMPRPSVPSVTSSVSAGPSSKKSSPAIVAFPNTPISQSGSLQSSLVSSNHKGLQTNHANNLSHHAVLLPQNSVSLLSGVSKLKSVLGNNSSGSSSKMMVSCLLKNKVVSIKTCPLGEVPKLSLNVDCYESMSQIVRYVAKNYPLVATKPDRSLHPYCAPSIKDFLNWNVGKRHAAEWQRAKVLQKQILELIQNSSQWKPEDIWSVKQLLLWCRYYGYSPMKTYLHFSETSESHKEANSKEFITHTESKDLVESLCDEQQQHQDLLQDSEDEEEDIDVETVDDKPQNQTAKSPEKPIPGSYFRLSSSSCGEFMRETVEQIGLKLMPEELPGNILAPLGEEVLLMAVKQFAEEILSSALARAFKNTEEKSYPGEVTVRDVGNAICEIPHCDFLTNRFLGTKLSKQLMNIVNVKL